MRSTENNAGAPLNIAAEWLAYLGPAPLLLCLAGVGLLPGYADRELAQRIALAWGAVLLAGSGALHLGLALAGRLRCAAVQVAGALLPALLAAVALVLAGQRGLALLVVGTGGFWLYEHRLLGALLPPQYLRVRRSMTLASCILLALTMFASDTAGLN